MKVIDRKDLITEQDLDDPLEDDLDTEGLSGTSLEDFDDLIDTIEYNSSDYDER